MVCYIIIRGPLGVGKTTVAMRLATILHAKYISIDSILEEKGLDEVTGGAIPLKNFLKANRIAVEKLGAAKHGAVFDGNFYYATQLDDLSARLGAKPYVFTLKARLRTCMARDLRRTRPLGETSVRDVFRLVRRVRAGVKIDSEGKSVSTVCKEILSHIDGRE